jgi:hypothetical protein
MVKRLSRGRQTWLLVGFLALMLAGIFTLKGNSAPPAAHDSWPFSRLLTEMDRVSVVTIAGNNIVGQTHDGRGFTTVAPPYPGLVDRLVLSRVVVYAGTDAEPVPSISAIVISWTPMLLIMAFYWYGVARPLRVIASAVAEVAGSMQHLVAGKRDGDPAPPPT